MHKCRAHMAQSLERAKKKTKPVWGVKRVPGFESQSHVIGT